MKMFNNVLIHCSNLRGRQFSIFTSLKYIVILENLTLLTELSHFGIVCHKLWFVLRL